jgi:hypothetical protein
MSLARNRSRRPKSASSPNAIIFGEDSTDRKAPLGSTIGTARFEAFERFELDFDLRQLGRFEPALHIWGHCEATSRRFFGIFRQISAPSPRESRIDDIVERFLER